MSTYSFGQPPVDALKLQNLQAILNLLPDNSQKLISPKDVRDSIFTTWENIIFKTTRVSTSDVEYIGIDQPLLKSKIFFGKKTVGGKEVMDDLLLNEDDYDHFFYSTRVEPSAEHNTRIGLLAGTGSFYKADILSIPYIEAKETLYTNLETYIDLDIRNKSFVLDNSSRVGGDINIISDWGNIQFNGVIFPKTSQNNETNNDKYLKFIWDPTRSLGIATWSSLGNVDTQSLVSSGTISISGSPVLINDRNVNFTDSNSVPRDIGGIRQGTTFNDEPVTEVLRRLIYPYILPTINTSFVYTFIESGDTTTFNLQRLNYTITFTEQLSQGFLNPSTLELNSPNFPIVNTLSQSPSNGFVRPLIPRQPTGANGSLTFTIRTTIEDQPTRGNSIVATSSCHVVLPWFYGMSINTNITPQNINNIIGSFVKLNRLGPSSGESVEVIWSTDNLPNKLGVPYFLYPSSYRDLANIIDENGFSVTSDYRKYNLNLNSPNGFWGNKAYKVYVYAPGGVPSLTIVNPLSKYTFIFSTGGGSGQN